jgi:hypothetical protein
VKNVKKNYKRVQAYNPALQYNSWQPEAYGTNIFFARRDDSRPRLSFLLYGIDFTAGIYYFDNIR